MASIYGTNKKKLSVIIPAVQQQGLGSLDCGVFAIANIVEFCVTGYNELDQNVRDWAFDMNQCRFHLLNCIKLKSFTTFPKLNLKQQVKIDRYVVDIDLFCSCGFSEAYGDMVACDRCAAWYHQRCVPDYDEKVKNWFCDKCPNKRARRKPKKIAN